MPKKKAWGGRFADGTDRFVEDFTASIPFDILLYRQDIAGSIAHARMLGRRKIIPRAEADRIVAALDGIRKEIEAGTLSFDLSQEDIHMAVEQRLTRKVGKIGGKLHTGRSRNDQVALDLRLYLRDEIDGILLLLDKVGERILKRAEECYGVVMPGYTHMQRAQPVLFSHHLLAYHEMFSRDRDRFRDARRRANVSPLGAGALAGTTFPLDRESVAEELGMDGVCENSIDAVSDRDFAADFLYACAVTMMHLSRLSEEMVYWSSTEFGFLSLPDSMCTGSSIMPQKKNPDVPELIRGKAGRAYGNLFSLLTVMKGLPLSYNRDMQEDKEPVFDSARAVKESLVGAALLIEGMAVDEKRMRMACDDGFLTATDLADYLARKGVPFRKAHEITGKIVRYCEGNGKRLKDLSLKELRSFHPGIDEDVRDAISLSHSVRLRNIRGGTGPEAVRRRLEELKKR
ncbi:MAG TPA: argininosuccinate lyase [Candidatus Deferrimicrobiaceae bacterium]|nr:argininosuccinate lyase [Candidatus Deferrimicrobiaceae bacterium]